MVVRIDKKTRTRTDTNQALALAQKGGKCIKNIKIQQRLNSAWFKSVGVLRSIRSHRDVALETEQAAEKQVGSQSPASEIRIAASSMMEHRQGHMILQGKTKSECLMNQPRTSTDTKTHPVTPRFHLAFGL